MSTQKSNHKSNDSRSVLTVGFNVRPLARSAKIAGFRVLAVDFWGDLDLPRWADHHVAVLNQQLAERADRPSIPTAQAFVNEVKAILETHGPVDYIFASGGFDDHPEEWESLANEGNLIGNSSSVMQRARDRTVIVPLAKECGAEIPTSYDAENKESILEAARSLELPIVVKPRHGSGGFFSRVLQTREQIKHYIERQRFDLSGPMLVQEHIEGRDVSVSLLGTGQHAFTISVNEQLIGLPQLGKGRTKAYCGNVVPLEAKSKHKKRLSKISESISTKLQLVGSNGFDYVIDRKGRPYFMEINPRFQATIEAIELVTRINLVKLHLDAYNGQLPKKSSKFKASCARIIVYAQTPSIIPDLREIPGVVDISHPGTLVNRGDPVCTVNHIAKNRTSACRGAWGIVKAVYHRLQPIPPKNG